MRPRNNYFGQVWPCTYDRIPKTRASACPPGIHRQARRSSTQPDWAQQSRSCWLQGKLGELPQKVRKALFRERSHTEDEVYPLYRRYSNGSNCIHSRAVETVNCHMDVQATSGISAVRYIHKNNLRGNDRARVQVQGDIPAGPVADADFNPPGTAADEPEPLNEVARHVIMRCISSQQACCRRFFYHMHQQRPAIYRLPVHLENQQIVYFFSEAAQSR
jgi:hypothetical protein